MKKRIDLFSIGENGSKNLKKDVYVGFLAALINPYGNVLDVGTIIVKNIRIFIMMRLFQMRIR